MAVIFNLNHFFESDAENQLGLQLNFRNVLFFLNEGRETALYSLLTLSNKAKKKCTFFWF
jgi:hypothetical protein